jgi:hypothetical protein
MMDKEAYEDARESSSGLFNNALVLPVAIAILHTVEEGATFVISELREELAGRVADNQIRDALKRIVSTGAAIRLTSDSRPRSDAWQRQAHPFWPFVGDWVGTGLAEAGRPKSAPE